MQHSADRILTTHVGSLMRPDNILAYSNLIAGGQPVDTQAYESTLRQEVKGVVRDQVEHGVDIVSDGEFGKASWTGYSLNRLTGFELRDDPDFLKFLGHDRIRFPQYYEESMREAMGRANRSSFAKPWVCVGPIQYTDQGRAAMRRDAQNLAAAVTGMKVREAFLPVVAPCSVAPSYSNEFYRSEEEFLFALASSMSPHSIMHCAASRKIVSATTCAGVVGRAHTRATCRSPRSWICCSRSTPRVIRSKRRTRGTSTSGRCGNPTS